ncbi:MAG: MBL fold metallo-hydrolase [Solibacillus sp.]
MNEVMKHGNKIVYPIMMPTDYNGMDSINCYMYQHGEDLTLIDAGIDTPEFEQFFWDKLAEYGLDAARINRIVLTHFHADHIGMVNTLVEKYGMPVYASDIAIPRLKCEEDYLRQKLDFYYELYAQYNVMKFASERMARLEATLTNKERVMLHTDLLTICDGEQIAGLDVLAAPGHSPDSVCLYDSETNWLFAGDFLLASGVTNALVDHDDAGQLMNPTIQYIDSIQNMQKVPISTVFAGHGELFSNATEVMENSIKKTEYKLQKVVAKIADGHETATSLGEAIYGPRFAKFFVFTISDVIGLTLLAEQRGLITREWLNDEWHFSKM